MMIIDEGRGGSEERYLAHGKKRLASDEAITTK